jgi:hypothetical protein
VLRVPSAPLLALVVAVTASNDGRAQEGPTDKRLDQLEKLVRSQKEQLDEQARQIQALRASIAPTSSAGASTHLETAPGSPRLAGTEERSVTESEGIEEEAKPGRIRKEADPRPRPRAGPQNLEEPSPPPGGQPIESGFHWSFNNGWFVAGKILGEDYLLRFMGRLHLEYRFFPPDQTSSPDDQFVVRRARFGVMGTYGDFRYRFELAPLRSDVGNPQLPITHFWVLYEGVPELVPCFGHYKTPFTLEDGFFSSNWIDFEERPMVVGSGDGVAPHYNPGAELMGGFGKGYFQYWVSVQDQFDNNTVTTGCPLASGRVESDVAGATFGADLYGAKRIGSEQTSFKGVTAGKFEWFARVPIYGWTYAWSADASFYAGPVWARAEYVWAHQDRLGLGPNGTDEPALLVRGAYVTVGWHFWGPPATSPRPQQPFKGWELFSLDIIKRRNAPDVGMELVFRAEYEDFSNETKGFPASDFFFGSSHANGGSSSDKNAVKPARCTGLETGINFDPIEGVRVMCDWYHYMMSGAAKSEAPHRRDSEEFIIRAQLAF